MNGTSFRENPTTFVSAQCARFSFIMFEKHMHNAFSINIIIMICRFYAVAIDSSVRDDMR